MKKGITKRVKKGWRLTKKQIAWYQEYIDPKFTNDCGHCILNLHFFCGLDPWK